MTDRAELERILAEQEATAAAEGQGARDPIVDSGLKALNVGADLLDVASCLRRLAGLLNGSDPLDRRVLRNRAVAELKRAKVTDAACLVDAALPGSAGHGDAGVEQGRAVMLSDPELWPEPVDGAVLLGELARTYSRFVALPPGGATALALWTIHAHALDAAQVSPLLVLASPEKRCGKTTTLKVLGALVPRPLPASSISPAALFRGVELFRPTLILDEADSVFRENEELRAVVNAAHDRGSAMVLRTVGEQHTPRAFSVWCPKAIALIGLLPGTLTDRAVVLPMQRRRRDEKVERLRLDRLGDLEPLRRQAARWARDHLDALRDADPEIPDALNDRAADNWRALLAIADQAAGPWPERARKAAGLLSGGEDDEDAPAVLLLADLRALFSERGADQLPTADILEHLTSLDSRPWPEWHHGRPLTARQLARLLERFRVRPRTIRHGLTTAKGYVAESFTDAWARYPPSDPSQRHNASSATTYGNSASVTASDGVTDQEPRKSKPANDVTDVTDQNPGSGQEVETEV